MSATQPSAGAAARHGTRLGSLASHPSSSSVGATAKGEEREGALEQRRRGVRTRESESPDSSANPSMNVFLMTAGGADSKVAGNGAGAGHTRPPSSGSAGLKTACGGTAERGERPRETDRTGKAACPSGAQEGWSENPEAVTDTVEGDGLSHNVGAR